MSVALINDHVWFPHVPNWAVPVTWSRKWSTEITKAVSGAELRGDYRYLPRGELSFVVWCATAEEQQQFEARVRAALASGKACGPYWGNGCELAAASVLGNQSLTLTASRWTWAVGDYVVVASGRTVTAIEVDGVGGAGLILSMATGLPHNVSAGSLVWPVVFGQLKTESLAMVTGHTGEMRLTIAQIDLGAATTLTWTPPAALSAPTLTSPVGGATVTTGTPTLTWGNVTGNDGYAIEVYDNIGLTGTPVSLTTLPNVTSVASDALAHGGTYYWRAKTLGDGSTNSDSAWSSAASFVVSIPQLTAPTLTAPANNALALVTTVLLDWDAVAGASGYDIELYNNAALTGSPVAAATVASTETSWTTSALTAGQVYGWRVRAAGDDVSYRDSAWSTSRSFWVTDDANRIRPSSRNNNTTFFRSGASIAAGTYRIYYRDGALRVAAGSTWYANTSAALSASGNGWRIVNTGGVNVMITDWLTGYSSVAAVEAAYGGQYVEFVHATGTLGMRFVDTKYTDNADSSPLIRFELVGPIV